LTFRWLLIRSAYSSPGDQWSLRSNATATLPFSIPHVCHLSPQYVCLIELVPFIILRFSASRHELYRDLVPPARRHRRVDFRVPDAALITYPLCLRQHIIHSAHSFLSEMTATPGAENGPLQVQETDSPSTGNGPLPTSELGSLDTEKWSL